MKFQFISDTVLDFFWIYNKYSLCGTNIIKLLIFMSVIKCLSTYLDTIIVYLILNATLVTIYISSHKVLPSVHSYIAGISLKLR